MIINIVIRMKQKYSYRLSIAIDEGGAGMTKASLDHVGQITNKSCLGVLCYSLQGLVRFRVFRSACHYELLIMLHATGSTLKYNYYKIILIKLNTTYTELHIAV